MLHSDWMGNGDLLVLFTATNFVTVILPAVLSLTCAVPLPDGLNDPQPKPVHPKGHPH